MRRMVLLLTLASSLAASACSAVMDRDQLGVCRRVLSAPPGGGVDIEGALIGSILIGLVEAGWSAYFDIDMRDIIVFTILIVMFVLRPGGLLGIAGPHARDV